MPLPIAASLRPLGTAISSLVSADPPIARRSIVDHVVAVGAERAGDPRRGLELDGVALPVAEASA